MTFRRPLIVLLVAGLCAAFPASAAEIAAPFATRLPDPRAPDRPCEPPIPPVTVFAPVSKYGQAGARRDAVDSEAEENFEAAMRPIREFSRQVVKAANDYHRTGRISAAACMAAQLRTWADADALKAPGGHTAWFKLATTLSGLSLAYLQVKPALRASVTERQAIEGWLNRRGRAVADYFAALQTPRSSRNNHRAWAGLATASAAAASGDRSLLTAGFDSYRIVVCQATGEGALPLELERGRKAVEYHLYALAALTTLAEIGERNGAPLLGACEGAIGRVAGFTLAAIRNPARAAELAGAPQEPAQTFLTASKLVFLEPWLARNPDLTGDVSDLLGRRPLGLSDLGGNQTMLYARSVR